jgi:hypothetical protein
MNSLKTMTFLMVAIMVLALSGCGGSSSGNSPFKNTSATVTPTSGATLFGNISTSTGKTGITLTTDRTTVDAINGQVLVTARVVNNGVGVAGVPVAFAIVAPLNGPATIEAGRTTVTTDANGEAITRITTGNATSTTNVIVAATATIGSRSGTANATFQIVRGTGVITMGTLPVKSANVDPSTTTSQAFQQQIPIRLTDANGFARVGAPVTLSVYTKSGSSTVAFTQATVNTDASGTAIFDATITMAAPAAGATAVESIIFKAATADITPIVAYAAGYYSVTAAVTSGSEPSIILTTDRTTYDVNDGSVLATAKIVRNGAAVSGIPVTFSVVAPTIGPATIEAGLTTVATDSNGLAVTRITTGTVASTTNVIIKATAPVGTQTVNATATFQLVPLLATSVRSYFNLILSVTDTLGTGNIVGPNSTVIASATLKDTVGNPVPNQQIKFEQVIGPVNAVTINPAVVTTDSNGMAVNFLVAGPSTPSAVDVIIKASTTVNGQLVTAIGMFKIQRSQSNIIKFLTSKAPTDPDGTLNRLAVTMENQLTPSSRTILQLVPFQILDNNGVPRSRVPVNISVYSEIGSCPVFIDSPEVGTVRTVTTDDTGLGIFNAGVTVEMPPIGSENACSIIYKAEAADPNNSGATIYSYGGFIGVLVNAKK